MNIDELVHFLSVIQSSREAGNLEESLSDITVDVDTDVLERDEIISILNQSYSHPEIVEDCSIDAVGQSGSYHLLRLTGSGFNLNQDAFRTLSQFTDVDGPDYEDTISSHLEGGRESQAIDVICDLLIEVDEQEDATIDFPLILDKSQIIEVTLNNGYVDVSDFSGLNPQFWYHLDSLKTWLEEHHFTQYSSRIFEAEGMSVVFYFEDIDPEVQGTSTLPVLRISEEFDISEGDIGIYKQAVDLVNSNTTFQSGAPIIPPSLFVESEDLQLIFREAFLYSIYSVFSDQVSASGPSFNFLINRGPSSIATSLDISEEANSLDADDFSKLSDLYRSYSRREDREVFVGFWRRSVAQHCDEISEIPNQIEAIKEHYRFIEAETVEGKFDDLSDAIRDTHAFMTDITSQVSETTRGLSDEIQRMVFTLLGAILANLFLVLRWGNIDMVVPFSLFVISVMLVFYFPLVDRRIEELDEMKSKSEEDYETYDGLITGFSGEAFDFQELENRKDDYMEYADQRIAWSKTNLRRIHLVLLILGLTFVGIATSMYRGISSQILLSVVFTVSVGYLAVRIYSNPEDHSYYKLGLPWVNYQGDEDAELFTNHLPLIILLVSIALILLNAYSDVLPTVGT